MYEQGSVATVKTENITHTSRRRRSAKPKSRAYAAAIDSPDQRLAFLLLPFLCTGSPEGEGDGRWCMQDAEGRPAGECRALLPLARIGWRP